MPGIFTHHDNWYIKQAKANLVQIQLHNIEMGKISNSKYHFENQKHNSDPIHTIHGIMTDNFKASLAASWKDQDIGLNLPGKLKAIQDFTPTLGIVSDDMAGHGSKAYKAGPYSSMKYQGTEGFSHSLKFTAYADADEMLGIKDGTLSTPLEAWYWLFVNQLPKEGRGMAQNIMNQALATANAAAKGIEIGIGKASDIGDELSEAWNAKKGNKVINLINAAATSVAGGFDDLTAQLNANPGNWIARITMSNMMSGWFVIESVDADVSRDRFHTGEPLYIDFSLRIKNYMIPDKAGVTSTQKEVVKYTGDSNASHGASEFSKMFIMSSLSDEMKKKAGNTFKSGSKASLEIKGRA